MGDQRLPSPAPFIGGSGAQPGRRTLRQMITLMAILVGAVLLSAALDRRPTTPIFHLSWFVPVVDSLLILIGACVTFLAFGRYHVLRDPASFWTGIGFSGFAVSLAFHLLTFPGAFAEEGSLVAGSPASPAWAITMASLILSGALLL
ncbi:MAG TPA: hypothetical protein VHO48_16455, partial [Anaerolineaceae bacterium]|nr:hypothetical protein [Anaerolineaceae bacterium]